MPITGEDILLYEKRLDKIAVITINRPEKANTLTAELMYRIADVWKQFEEDEDAWVAILTGSGDKAFCAGMDLAEQADRDKKGVERPRPNFTPHWISKPTIAAINGYAIAGGWLLAQICDVRIASENAEMGISEVMWNLPAPWAADITRQLNIGHALEIALWGDKRITAQRGYEMGWINKVVPTGKVMDEAMSWAERMTYLGPRAVRDMKETIYRGYYMPSEEGRRYGLLLAQNLKGMEDSLEGPRAFVEKRKPQYKNR